MAEQFPKTPDGRHPAGEAAARSIAGDGLWLRKRRFGAESRNKGGHLLVRYGPQSTGAYYCAGDESTGRVLRASASARGLFDVVRPVPAGGAEEPNVVSLLNRGDGKAVVSGFGAQEYMTTEIPHDVPSWLVHQYLTRDGREFTSVDMAGMTLVGGALGSVGPYLGGALDPSGGGVFVGGVWTYIFVVDSAMFGAHTLVYGCIVDDTLVFTAPVDSAPFEMVKHRGFGHVSPMGRLTATMGVMWARPVGWAGADVTETPLLRLLASDNAGVTWALLPEPPMLATVLNEWRSYLSDAAPSDLIVSQWQDRVVAPTAVTVTPFEPGKAIVCVSLPTFEGYDPTPRFNNVDIGANYYRLLYDTATHSFTELDRVEFAAVPLTTTRPQTRAHALVQRPPTAVPGGILYFELVDPDDFTNTPLRIVFTPTGGPPYTIQHETIWPARHCGVVTMPQRGVLFMTVYDGDYGLYESRDLGATWRKRATASPYTAPPTTDTGVYRLAVLTDFGQMTHLRENDRGVNPLPATPWASDERITP